MSKTCDRCKGLRWIKVVAHRDGGRCYACNQQGTPGPAKGHKVASKDVIAARIMTPTKRVIKPISNTRQRAAEVKVTAPKVVIRDVDIQARIEAILFNVLPAQNGLPLMGRIGDDDFLVVGANRIPSNRTMRIADFIVKSLKYLGMKAKFQDDAEVCFKLLESIEAECEHRLFALDPAILAEVEMGILAGAPF